MRARYPHRNRFAPGQDRRRHNNPIIKRIYLVG
jgi:hypothetical protein